MAITQASLTSGTDVSQAGTSTTASIAPSANCLVVLAVWTTDTPPAVGTATVTGASMTWVVIGTESNTDAGTNLTLFRALSATPGTGALTIDHAAAPDCCVWSVMEFAGVDTGGTDGSGAVVQFVSNEDVSATVATVTATLAAFGSVDNGAYSAHGYFNASALPTATADTGWTEIHDLGSLFSADVLADALETQWRATNDTTALATWTSNGAIAAAAIELKAATAGTFYYQPTTLCSMGVQ